MVTKETADRYAPHLSAYLCTNLVPLPGRLRGRTYTIELLGGTS